MKHDIGRWFMFAVIATASACATAPSAPTVPELRPGILAGYLAPEALPDSLTLLPPAPGADSATAQADAVANRTALALHGSPRWQLAIADAQLSFPDAASTFACALGAEPNATTTPSLYRLLRRTLADAGLSTYAAKRSYARARPFMVNGEPLCTPDDRAMLESDGSYPSGHAAIGWAWGLVIAELAPDRANAIFARAYAFGESRSVCNVHWPSDIDAGRVMGAVTVARLHADATFTADLGQARRELQTLRASDLGAGRDCEAEAAALAR